MTDRTQGILNRASDAPKFSGVRWILGDGVLTNYMQSYVDDTMKRNAEFQSRAGVSPKIVRKSPTKCCPWCDALVGEYKYPDDVPDMVYHRHDNCNCIVEFYPGDGRKQSVWDSPNKWEPAEPEVLKERRKVFPRRATPAQLEERKMVGAEPTQVKPQDAPKAVLDFEKKSRSLAKERAIMVDPDGKVYAQSQGRTRSVSIKDAPKEGYTLSHNHPAPVTFSVADVKQFEANGFKQIRAVTAEKTYILEAIDPKKLAGEDRDFTGAMYEHWEKLDEESARMRKQMREEAMQIEDRAERGAFLNKRMQGILDWRNKAESEWLYKNAKKYGYIYWEEPVK